jgi:pilus assembly protein CpaB
MKPARVVIMAVAVLAAGLAGYLAMNLTSPTVQVNEISASPVIEKMPTSTFWCQRQPSGRCAPE